MCSTCGNLDGVFRKRQTDISLIPPNRWSRDENEKKLQSISSDRKGEEKVLGVIDVKKTEEEREGEKSTKAAPAAEGTDAISRFGDGFAK